MAFEQEIAAWHLGVKGNFRGVLETDVKAQIFHAPSLQFNETMCDLWLVTVKSGEDSV